ncbi:FecR family protein [Flexithrix dorotheae]|uniref:FecR family protein n=1 Tax=Flexithrix dorotheae TaxID=70993 RepID=UPI0003608B93|nr:FecR family protein [Flexithrix dorotheae]
MNNKEEFLKNDLFNKWVESDNSEVNDYWDKWMEENPDLAEELMRTRDLLRSIKFEQYKSAPGLVAKSWESVDVKTRKKTRVISFNFFIKAAAIITFLIVSIFVVRNKIETDQPEILKEDKITFIEKTAEKGIKLTVQLSDGSKIKLNSGSKLIYPSVFAKGKREVQLIGEGYFEIAREESRPFEVKTGNLLTTVLGTKFSINGFDKKNITVALVSGSVRVEELDSNNQVIEQSGLLLEPTFKAVFKNGQLDRAKVDNLLDLGWKDGTLVFKNHDIDDIKERLENWFGVTIEIKNKAKIAKSFDGVYKSEPLGNVLKSISFAMNFNYQINGNNVYITGK